jgi:hypothetical protein
MAVTKMCFVQRGRNLIDFKPIPQNFVAFGAIHNHSGQATTAK